MKTDRAGANLGGRAYSSEELLSLVYEELRRLAETRMRREPPGSTLQPTALVHEAFLRLAGDDPQWDDRGHFFAAAAEAMRRILVEKARRRASTKHGGRHERDARSPDDVAESSPLLENTSASQILAVEEALRRMEERDSRMGEVVKLRFFAGLSIDETALAMNVSARTVRREWTFAKAWLARELATI